MTSTLQVNCFIERPSCSQKFDVHSRDSLPSSLSFKPIFRRLQQNPILANIPNFIKEASVRLLDTFVDLAFEFVDQPLLPSQGNFAPVEELGDAVCETSIEGRIPDDFPEGVYIRNGPNPLFGALKSTKSMFGKSSHTWIEGEGMLHALYFCKERDGSWITSYNNRYVQTDTFKLEKKRNKPAFLPAIEGDSQAVLSAFLLNMLRFGLVDKYLSNTNVFEYSSKFYSISENHIPQDIDIRTPETLGNWDINKAWRRPFTSHPKSVCFKAFTVVVVLACRSHGSIIPGPDFGLNKFEWYSKGFKHSVKEIDEKSQQRSFFSRAYEWRLNMCTGEVEERNLTGTEYSMDFPMMNEKFVGLENKFGYTQVVDSNASSISGLLLYN
ncbi:carotenoid 9 [Forsythia ovata]|uniref:Carotenoid 9 n=1 Tax=Forsythia ovata TaxID=205694 RepID=A0ABD1W5J2_9LAMI